MKKNTKPKIWQITLTLLTISYMLFAIVFTTAFPTVVSAQTATPTPPPTVSVPDPVASDLTFPINDLGGCKDYGSCSDYCDDPVNNAKCIEFAKKGGFYQQDKLFSANDDFFNKAKEALGCDSTQSCFNFCDSEANFDKCSEFAKQQDLLGGYVYQPDKPQYLELAKSVLGCDSFNTCASFCDNQANSGKCNDFANQVGLLGGIDQEGPGGCISDTTCQSYCSDPNNFDQCKVYVPENAGQFTGPGGCDSSTKCRTYCEENSTQCRSYAPGSNGVYVPVACPANHYFGPGGTCTPVEKTQEAAACSQAGKYWSGTGCLDQPPPGITPTAGNAFFQPRPEMGNCKTPAECYDYCSQNSGKCPGFNSSYERPKDDYIPTLYYTPGTEVKFEPKKDYGNCDSPGSCYDWCKQNAGKCGGFDSNSPRPFDTYVPGVYYTPPPTYTYFTPSATSYYVTPIYYTPPEGSNYTTPSYYTPGSYYTPSYYTPYQGSNYTTPSYYTPGTYYVTPTGSYPTPSYLTPNYYTPPEGSNYTTPSYYTPPPYNTPYYYTPSDGSYTTPTYQTPPPYGTPTYGTPSYYTPGETYSYPSPSYYTPGYSYPSPTYGTPSYSYPSPTYFTPSYSYPSPTYGTPTYEYPSPSYGTPTYGTPTYETPSYAYPSPVQGAHTTRNIFQTIWDFLLNR